MEDEAPETQEDEKTLSEIQDELNIKDKKFFETTSYISSHDDFDNFLYDYIYLFININIFHIIKKIKAKNEAKKVRKENNDYIYK